jgi:WD40 repeat protein
VESGECEKTLGGHGQFVTSLALSPDGARLAAGTWFGEIILWDAATLELVGMFRAHDNTIRAVDFDRTGKWLASCSYDQSVRIADASPSGERRTRRHQAQANYAAAQQMIERLSRTCDTTVELVKAVEGDAPANEGACAWARKIVLMKELEGAEAAYRAKHAR